MVASSDPQGWVKINFNAHFGEVLMLGVGMAIHNDKGKLLVVSAKHYRASWNVKVAEVAAASFTLEVALHLGFSNVIVAHVFLLCKSVASFNIFICNHLSRSGNCVAHWCKCNYKNT